MRTAASARTGSGMSSAPTETKTALVIGAGLAGANIAERLAARGWQIEVVESADAPALGASGNPAGIVRPQLARDDALAARFSRACYTYLLHRLAELPECQWTACGVLQIARDNDHEALQQATVQELKLPPDYVQFLSRGRAEQMVGQPLSHGAWWFPQGGWLNPATLCTALLARFQNTVRCSFRTAVVRLSYDETRWTAYNADDQPVATAHHVVLANAHAANNLLEQALPLTVIRGQINYLPADALPPVGQVLCRNGYLTPAYDGYVSFGASFVNDDIDQALRPVEQTGNLQRLQEILPKADLDRHIFGSQPLMGRVALRTATPDRLPLVGGIPACTKKSARLATQANLMRLPGLYALLGLSARGIVWAPLAAEHLACLMNDEPSPLPADMANAIDAGRFLVKQLRRG